MMADPVEVAIPEPGTSDARSGRWLGFAADCDCHVVDNNAENDVACTNHTDDAVKTDTCGHVIHPDCALHRGWSPGDTAEVEDPRWGAFSVVPPEHADAHAQWMADHA